MNDAPALAVNQCLVGVSVSSIICVAASYVPHCATVPHAVGHVQGEQLRQWASNIEYNIEYIGSMDRGSDEIMMSMIKRRPCAL